jgi:hypothetical protein
MFKPEGGLMRTDVQLRYSPTDFELRGTVGEGATLSGHAAVFNTETVIANLFREQIMPRSFRKTIKQNDIRALVNHEPSLVLGRNKSGTLRLAEDDIGLLYDIDLPNTQAARDVWVLIDRRDITGSSFSFVTVREDWEEAESEGGLPLVSIREARLFDVSPVTFPAYEETDVVASARVRLRAAGFALPEERGVVPFGDLPLADKGGGWDAAAAKSRVQAWAGGADWSPSKYRRAFLWYDSSAPDLLGSYKLPFADVRGGSLKAVPEGIYAAAQRLDGAQIPAADKAGVRSVLDRYYEKLGEESPWNRSAEATTQTPESAPLEEHPDSTSAPEPQRDPFFLCI